MSCKKWISGLLLLTTVACGQRPEDLNDCEAYADCDWDSDGWTEADGDCDDYDETINPGAPEGWYDGVDQDCSGTSDFDADGDGFDWEDDCDDLDATRYPGAEEVLDDGEDQDCDGLDSISEPTDDDPTCDGNGNGSGNGSGGGHCHYDDDRER